jgi:hypothetical protein
MVIVFSIHLADAIAIPKNQMEQFHLVNMTRILSGMKSNKQNKWTLLGFDSQEEYWFDAWLKELGIKYQYKPEPFVLCQPVKLKLQKQRSVCDIHLLHGLEYQPDFRLDSFPDRIATILTSVDVCDSPLKESPKNVLFLSSAGQIFCDTKGSNFMGSSRASDVRFPVVSKIVFQKYFVYTNSVIPEKLFERTFAPECFFWSETGKERTKKGVPFSKLYKRLKDVI